MTNANALRMSRRGVVNSGLALAGARIAGPFVISARAADAVKIGLDNPLTGPLASLGKNEPASAVKMAIDAINAKSGILGRPVELIVEDFEQWGRRDCGYEGAQADRRREDRFSFRQHELGAFCRHGRGIERAGDPAHRPPAATLMQSRARVATGTSFASAAPLKWRRTRSLAR